MQNLFQKATKKEAKLRLAISGPSGSGKTYTSLEVAKHLGGKVAYVDTEHGSASKYAELFAFDVINMEAPYHPERYCEFIDMAAAAGYDVLIIDSLSHAWNGKGGLLEIVDDEMAKAKTRNSMAGWKKATPIHNAMIEKIISAKMHIIATMRSKQEYLIEKDSKGKTHISKVGLAPIQRDGMEYEFDVWGEMDIDNRMTISKTRCPVLTGQLLNKPGKNLATPLLEWLRGEKVVVDNTPVQSDLVYTTAERQAFHAIGGEVYGAEWDSKRKELVSAVSKKRTESMKELTRPEFDHLMKGMKEKQQAQRVPQNKGDVSEALYGQAA